MDCYFINIGIFGSVSSGKSTLINSIFGSTISPSGTGRTTMTINEYSLSPDFVESKFMDFAKIYDKNTKSKNITVEQRVTVCDLKNSVVKHTLSINHIHPIVVTNPKITVNIYDFPGINDEYFNMDVDNYFYNTLKSMHIIINVVDLANFAQEGDTKLRIILSNFKKVHRYMSQNYSFDCQFIHLVNKYESTKPDHEAIYKRISSLITFGQIIKMNTLKTFISRVTSNPESFIPASELDIIGNILFGKEWIGINHNTKLDMVKQSSIDCPMYDEFACLINTIIKENIHKFCIYNARIDFEWNSERPFQTINRKYSNSEICTSYTLKIHEICNEFNVTFLHNYVECLEKYHINPVECSCTIL